MEFKSISNPDGSYEFSYTLLDGTHREERGEIVYDSNGFGELKVSGLYSYYSPNNEYNEVRFTSDRNGYRPEINNSIQPSSPKPAVNYNIRIASGDGFGGGVPDNGPTQEIFGSIGRLIKNAEAG